MSWAVRSMLPVWVLAIAGALVIAFAAGEGYLTWLPVLMALCVLAAFGIQLLGGRREGLVTRLGGSLIGALIVLVVATLVLVLVEPAGVHIL